MLRCLFVVISPILVLFLWPSNVQCFPVQYRPGNILLPWVLLYQPFGLLGDGGGASLLTPPPLVLSCPVTFRRSRFLSGNSTHLAAFHTHLVPNEIVPAVQGTVLDQIWSSHSQPYVIRRHQLDSTVPRTSVSFRVSGPPGGFDIQSR
jgi:hypothetical protein